MYSLLEFSYYPLNNFEIEHSIFFLIYSNIYLLIDSNHNLMDLNHNKVFYHEIIQNYGPSDDIFFYFKLSWKSIKKL